MRERWNAILLLVRTAWRTDPWRSAGLLLEPLGHLRFPLFAWCLKLMAEGVMQHDPRKLAWAVAGITATRAFWFLGTWSGAWIRIGLTERVAFAFDREVATLLAGLPGLEHHERPDVQDRLELLRQRQAALGNSLNALINTANALVAGVGTLVALAWVNPWLLLLVPFALPVIPIAAVKQRWHGRAEERFAGPTRHARNLQALTVDRNAGMELRVFGLQREVLSRFRAAWSESRRGVLRVERNGALLDTLADLVFMAGYAGAVGLMLWRAGQGRATAGEVVMVVYLGQQVRMSVLAPVFRVARLGEALRAASRLLWLREYARGARPGGSLPAPAALGDGIVFDRVGFRYPGTDRWALRDVSFRIPAGSVVALVGENGAGKTTLVKLLSRMYEPTEGRI
ncbi:MAG TPA: ABC transporter ATP-binding protein, partial [Longimicrobium sp.]|nr:ABC transporter ATP-binding protein [Longimicrobium sp.]